jgi:uncharacterized membrane protein HdeD (DUF308 family)
MLGGIILIISGLLIAIFPQLLSIIIATLLIISGMLTLMVAYQNRKLNREFGNPITRVFFRF